MFRMILIADLHVEPRSLPWCLRTLRVARKLALKHDAEIVFLGDFWHRRGVIEVRQLHEIQQEFDRWKRKKIPVHMIPGNHDQVDREGVIHGVKIFEAYRNIRVYDEPTFLKERKIAFIPWIEDPAQQAEAFAALPPDVTVFAHGEAPGARTNSRKTADGRFALPTVRSLYLGHYHKRQRIGQNCWYIGSPYERDMGERDEPHGVALVTSEEIVPTWFDVPNTPKHFRLRYPEDLRRFVEPSPIDIVEIEVHSKDRNDAFREAVASLAVRAEVFEVSDSESEPQELQNVWTFDQALEAYLSAYACEGVSSDLLRQAATGLISEVPDAELGARGLIRFLSVQMSGFGMVADQRTMKLNKRGLTLLRGPMGSGKTTFFDAITWCLFETTTPRKATGGAAVRADGVINDDCEVASVKIRFVVRGTEGKSTYEILRTKRRGKGSVVEITKDGQPYDSGVSDSQQQIRSILGLSYELWRACVYLGQGALSNFVVEADKKRKELITSAAGLHNCPAYQTRATKQRKIAEQEHARCTTELAGIDGELRTCQALNFDADYEAFETDRQTRLQQIAARRVALGESVREKSEHLEREGEWNVYRARLDQDIQSLQLRLGQVDTSAHTRLHSQLATAQAERESVDREARQAQQRYEQLQASPTCPQCGQALPSEQLDGMIQDAEQQIQTIRGRISTLDMRIQDFRVQIERLGSHDTAQEQGLRAQLTEANDKLQKCVAAQNAFVQIREHLAATQAQLQQLDRDEHEIRTQTNPHVARAEQTKQKIAELQARRGAALQQANQHQQAVSIYRYWEKAFGQSGIVVMVLRPLLRDLESRANHYLSRLSANLLHVDLELDDDAIVLRYWERKGGSLRERQYGQLSGGQRRCFELAFTPFALSDLIFQRLGVRVELAAIDELTTHMDAETKARVPDILREFERETILVAEHDAFVQGVFDNVIDMEAA